jgi:hypothetical protein
MRQLGVQRQGVARGQRSWGGGDKKHTPEEVSMPLIFLPFVFLKDTVVLSRLISLHKNKNLTVSKGLSNKSLMGK